MKSMEFLKRAILLGIVLQSLAVPGLSQAVEHKWSIEGHIGGTFSMDQTSGSGVTFPRAREFTTINGQPSRHVTSWFFGDGTVLMNQVMIAMGKAPDIRLIPLDPALNQSSLTKESTAAFGLRVTRVLNRRLEVEGSVDYKRKGLVIRPESLAAIEATRSSFITAWSNAGLPNASVTSTSTIRNEESRELLSTGSLILNLKPEGRLVPFASGGLGVITQTSGPPSAELRGAYPFGVGPFQINESDTVSIGYDVPHHTVVGLLGGGVKYRLSDRWGLRGDGRVILGSNKGDTVIDTRSTVTTNTASGFTIVSSTNPAFQFSSDQSVRSSSLSGSPLSRFRTFTSEGTQTEFGLSGGIFFRF